MPPCEADSLVFFVGGRAGFLCFLSRRAAANPEARMLTTGQYPATPQPDFRAGVHFLPGNDGRLAVCLHICEGGFQPRLPIFVKLASLPILSSAKAVRLRSLVNVHDSAQAQGLRYGHAPR